ncbi:hypothetical protein Tco_1483120 [Tanacetum coccineum]
MGGARGRAYAIDGGIWWGSHGSYDRWSGGVPAIDGRGGGGVGVGLEMMTIVVGRGRGDGSDDVDGDEVMKMVRVTCHGDGEDETGGELWKIWSKISKDEDLLKKIKITEDIS